MKHFLPILTALMSIVMLLALDKMALRVAPEYGPVAQMVTMFVVLLNAYIIGSNMSAYARRD